MNAALRELKPEEVDQIAKVLHGLADFFRNYSYAEAQEEEHEDHCAKG